MDVNRALRFLLVAPSRKYPYPRRRRAGIGSDDKNVTRFCQGVTWGDEVETLGVAGFDTNGVGRGESAGTLGVESRRSFSWCRRCAGLVVVLLLACDAGGQGAETGEAARVEAPAPPAAKAPQEPVLERPGKAATAYYQAYLDETLRGDFDAARRAYRGVVEDTSADPRIAARAALRLAEYEPDARRRHHALQIVAKAAARTTVESMSPAAADRFAHAEGLLAAYHARRLRPRLEDLRAGVRSKRHALDAAVRGYRRVIALGEPVATVAAEFRIASLSYDLALALTFDLPPELEEDVASELRRSLRAQAVADRNRAQAAYARALEAGRDGRAGPAATVWLEAAELGLRSVASLAGR
jgi:hypothetical protein